MNIKNKTFFKPNAQYVFILSILAFLLIKLGFFFLLGIRYGSDSSRYVGLANYLIGQQSVKPIFSITYYLYPFLIYIFKLIFDENFDFYLVLFQIFFSGIGVCFLYLLIKNLLDKQLALLGLILYILMFETSFWDFYILTDSVSLNLFIFNLYFFLRLLKNKYNLATVSFFLFSFLLIPFSRPSLALYFIFALTILIFKICKHLNINKKVIFSSLFIICLLLLFLNYQYIFKLLFHMVEKFHDGYIVFHRDNYKLYNVNEWNQMTISTQFISILKILLYRFLLMWSPYISGYSKFHNIINILPSLVFNLTTYGCIFIYLKNIRKSRKNIEITTILLLYLLYFIFLISYGMDYDFRHKLILYPLAVILTTYFIKFLKEKSKVIA
jgi:hypothetical protein